MDRVLVTGANGFIGQHLVKKLIEKDYLVHGLVMPNTALGELSLLDNKSLKLVQGDLTNYNSLLNATKDVNEIIHLAGIVKYVNLSDGLYWDINVNGTENLLKACVENKLKLKRFIYCSTVDVYGGLEDQDKVISEDFQPKPKGIYSKTKYESELVCNKYNQEHKIPITILRPGRVYGEGDLTFLPFLRLIKRKLYFNIGTRDTYMSSIYVEDLVNAFILALENPKAIGNTYIITNDEIVTKKEFANTIASELNIKLSNLSLPKSFVIPPVYVLEKLYSIIGKNPPFSTKKLEFFLQSKKYSIEKAKKELGYKQQTSIKEGIRRTVEWYKKRNLI